MHPVIYGEVLFDVFPETSLLGGAAFNVAWHLHGFGMAPLFISRIGEDERGEAIHTAMRGRGMNTSGVQIDADRPTGQVHVSTVGTDHVFSILPDQAYDFIDQQQALAALPADPSLLYHGSLIARNAVSHASLVAVRHAVNAPFFIDINLRDPWWDREVCLSLMDSASWIKINHEELNDLSRVTPDCVKDGAKTMRHRLNLGNLIVTRAEHGALLCESNHLHTCVPCKRAPDIIDTVGAGDSFSSVMMLGTLKGWTPEVTLQRAQAFAQNICRQRGAVIHDLRVYEDLLEAWEREDATAFVPKSAVA